MNSLRTPFIVLMLAAAGAGTLFYLNSGDSTNPASMPDTTQAAPSENRPETVADRWHWPESSGQQTKKGGTPASDFPFTADGVFQALQTVRIDGNGHVIIDSQTLEALNQTFRHGRNRLEPHELEALQELIKAGLPGTAGEETARIVGDYHRFLQARRQKFTEDEANDQPESLEATERRYSELRQLREEHLGDEVARKLFREEDATAQYMLEAQRVAMDPDLSAEEKIARSATLSQQLQEQILDIDNWPERRAAFERERQQIEQAGLSEADKQSQIRTLKQQHFDQQELERLDEHYLGDF